MRLSGIVLTTFLSTLLAVSACSSPVDPDGMPEGPRMRGVAAVALNPASAALPVGSSFLVEAIALDALGQPLDGRRIDWSSSNTAVATVTSSGNVRAIAPGEASIVAASEGRSGSTAVVVSPSSEVGSVRITTTATIVPLHGTLKLNVEVRDTTNKVLAGRQVTWSTSNASAARIDSKGLVSGIAIGTSTITAEADGSTAAVVLNVRPAEVASVAVQPKSIVVLVGETASLSSLLRDADGNSLSQRIVTWTSSAPGVATVSTNGVIVGQSLGTTTITATSEGKSGTATVTVAPHNTPDRVTVSPTSASLYPGDEVQLQGSVLDNASRVISGATIQWHSSNTGIARVSGSGNVTAVAPGSATITATSNGKSASATITVRTSPVTSIVISPSSLSIEEGRSAQLTATLRDSRGVIVTGRSITWSTSNSSVATVTDGLVVGMTVGSATVSARSEGITSTVPVSVLKSSTPPGTFWRTAHPA
jgi:trimeric autotransporter adhesin